MGKILDTTAYNPNFEQHITWQFDNSKCLKSIINSKKTWYDEEKELALFNILIIF